MTTIDTTRHEVRVGPQKKRVMLAPKEFSLLLALGRANGRVLDRKELLGQTYGPEEAAYVHERTLDQHVARIRSKIGAGAITTVTNYGYRGEDIAIVDEQTEDLTGHIVEIERTFGKEEGATVTVRLGSVAGKFRKGDRVRLA